MLFSILSAILLILSFPNFNLSYLAFVSFVPLFFAIKNKPPKRAFWISYVCGFLFYLGVLYWLYHVTVFGLVALCLYLALYLGFFGFVFNRITSTFKPSPFTFLLIPFIWVILEYIQSRLFTGFGWALLGYSQYKNLRLIQIADFSDVYGVSFVIMMANVAIYRFFRRSSRELLLVIVIILIVIAYGTVKINKKTECESVNISIIQGNIPQDIKWAPGSAEDILNKYINLTRMAAFDNPDLIIWPETSFPDFFSGDRKMTKRVLALAKQIKIPLLLGANTEQGLEDFNSAVLISKKGEIVGKYDKIHLVPFGEYVPFSDKLPLLHRLVLGQLGEFTAGKEYKVFTIHERKRSTAKPPRRGRTVPRFRSGQANDETEHAFAVLICFEDIFPEISKKFVRKGARFLVVITNDAWYGRSGAAYQHAACSVFRAIENRIPVVRCANTGYSCFIDSRGRIYDAVGEDGAHLFITGHKTSHIALR